MLRLRTIRQRLESHTPRIEPVDRERTLEAAVALVLHEPQDGGVPELLFIRRVERDGDPWSGHMAFPGGRRQSEDVDLAATALRETSEEVGFVPDRILGRLDDSAGSRGPQVPHLVVAALVCEAEDRPRIQINHEVQEAVWIPLDHIVSLDARAEYRVSAQQPPRPAFRYEDYVVWGLTYRILGSFLHLLGASLHADAVREPPGSQQGG